MDTLRDKLEQVAGGSRIDAIMHIIDNHITWSSYSTCRFAHVFSDCGAYEIDSRYNVYYLGNIIAARHDTQDAKQAAQTHKEGRV